MLMFEELRSRLDHRYARPNLSAYLDRRVTEGERNRIDRHLAVCASCREDLATLRETVQWVRQAPRVVAPRAFTLPATAREAQTRYRRWDSAFLTLRSAATVATVLLFLLVSGDAALRVGVTRWPALTGSPQGDNLVTMAVAEDYGRPVDRMGALESSPEGARGMEVAPQEPAAVPEVGLLAQAPESQAAPPEGVQGTPPRLGTTQGLVPDEAPAAAPSEPQETPPPAIARAPLPASPDAAALADEQDRAQGPDEADAVPVRERVDDSSAESGVADLAVAGAEVQGEVAEDEARVAETYGLASPGAPAGLYALWEGLRLMAVMLVGLLFLLLGATLWAGYQRRA